MGYSYCLHYGLIIANLFILLAFPMQGWGRKREAVFSPIPAMTSPSRISSFRLQIGFYENSTSNTGELQLMLWLSRGRTYPNKRDTVLPIQCDSPVPRFRICKEIFLMPYEINEADAARKENLLVNYSSTNKPKSPVLIQIAGDLQYDFLYRSYIDIPYSQRDFQQHTIQAVLRVKVKDNYPINIGVSTQQNNSPFLRNLHNINLQFDPITYLNEAKKQLLEKLKAARFAEPQLNVTESALKHELELYNAVNTRLTDPDLSQQLVAEKERIYNYYRALDKADPQIANIATDSSYKEIFILSSLNAAAFEARLKKDKDSLQQRIMSLQRKRDSLRHIVQKDWTVLQQNVFTAKSYQEVRAIAVMNGIPLEGMAKQNFFSHLRSIGVGRSLLNYSELTAWNVGLTGINIEYNKKVYAAFAGGKIDYGFREFLGKHTRVPNQSFFLSRIGFGEKERKAIILSFFTGKKSNYGMLSPDTTSALTNIAGYAVEAILQKNEQTAIHLEVAKTTRLTSGSFSTNNELKSLFDFNDFTNIGVNVKGRTIFQPTAAKISGFYRMTGQDFQSFNLFTYRTQQTAWQIRLEQSFLKEKVNLVGMLRKNDFTNPFTDKTFQTNTLFTTIQVSAHVPKYPQLSVGYYPGTQLYVVDQQQIRENVYYILNGSLTYPYKAGGVQLSTSFHLNHFSNKGTDSGFIVYSGISYLASQTMTMQRLQWQGTYAHTRQEEMNFSTLESNVDYSLTRDVRIGAGAKYNHLQSGEVFWGSRLSFNATIKTLGRLQLQYEKTYVPTVRRSLFPIEMGRVTWFKHL